MSDEPVSLTSSQQQALDLINDFLQQNDRRCFLLGGYAGTGKTHLIGLLTNQVLDTHRQVVLLAPTGRAARVLGHKTGLPASTVHSHIYTPSSEEVPEEEDQPGVIVAHFKVKGNQDPINALYIVDESSMISDIAGDQETVRFGSGRLLADLIEFVGWNAPIPIQGNARKVIFVGDPAQLPPVQGPFSPALSEEYLKKEYGIISISFTMTDVVRQKSDSGIVDNSLRIRSAIEKGNYQKFQITPAEDVEIVSSPFSEIWNGLILKNRHKQVMVVTWSNDRALQYNKVMRHCLWGGRDEDQLLAGDRVMCVANNRRHLILNGELFEILEVCPYHERQSISIKGRTEQVELLFRDARIRFADDFNQEIITECKLLENILWSNERALSRDELLALRIEFETRREMRYPRKKLWKENPSEFKKQREEYLLALQEDPYYNAVHVKFGFAVTCHKAQGGEWDEVFVDFRGPFNTRNERYFRWAYTAITRAKRHLYALFAPNLGAIDIRKPAPAAENAEGPKINSPDTLPSPTLVGQRNESISSDFASLLGRDVREICTPYGFDLVSSTSHKYLERIQLKRGDQVGVFDITYNGKHIVSKITSKGGGTEAFVQQALSLLISLKGKRLFEASNPSLVNPIFSEDQVHLREIHDEVLRRIIPHGIAIYSVEHLQYRERYTFQHGKSLAIVDLIYDGDNVVTGIERNTSLSTSLDLLGKVTLLLAEEQEPFVS